MAIKEINVENGFTSDEALAYVKQVLSNSKRRVFTLFKAMVVVEKVVLFVKKLEVFLMLN